MSAKQFTIETLGRNGADLAEVEEWWTDHLHRLDDGYTYDDLLDEHLDGAVWSDDSTVELPNDFMHPVWRRLLAIGRRVRKELAT